MTEGQGQRKDNLNGLDQGKRRLFKTLGALGILATGAAIENQTHFLASVGNFLGIFTRRNPEARKGDPQFVKEAKWLDPSLSAEPPEVSVSVALTLNENVDPTKLVGVLTVHHTDEIPDTRINPNGGWPIVDIQPLTPGEHQIVHFSFNPDKPNESDNPIPKDSESTLAVNIHAYTMNEGKMIIDPRGQNNVANYLVFSRPKYS